mmetsp:Transcript_21310/g.46537  ORF Transcript_21310/g.46537 Transcript_21310/m.46537 type:complete len:254 (-) Transcript_21310:2217-2978(-)
MVRDIDIDINIDIQTARCGDQAKSTQETTVGRHRVHAGDPKIALRGIRVRGGRRGLLRGTPDAHALHHRKTGPDQPPHDRAPRRLARPGALQGPLRDRKIGHPLQRQLEGGQDTGQRFRLDPQAAAPPVPPRAQVRQGLREYPASGGQKPGLHATGPGGHGHLEHYQKLSEPPLHPGRGRLCLCDTKSKLLQVPDIRSQGLCDPAHSQQDTPDHTDAHQKNKGMPRHHEQARPAQSNQAREGGGTEQQQQQQE